MPLCKNVKNKNKEVKDEKDELDYTKDLKQAQLVVSALDLAIQVKMHSKFNV